MSDGTSEECIEDQKLDPFLIHEALDRSNLVLDQLERALGENSVIQNDRETKALYDNAVESLASLYQLLGQKSFASRE